MSANVKFAFVASLIVNVFLVGVLLGEVPRRFNTSLSREERMEKVTEALPEPQRTQFHREMARLRERSEPVRQQIREAREEAIRILMAEPFDAAAYDRQVKKIHDLYGQRSQRMAEFVKEIATALPQEQRQVLAEVLRRPPSPSPQ